MESRNPTIVRILEEKGSVIENRHSGIPTMKREMKKYSLPEPEFYEERNCFKVVFRNRDVVIQSGTQKIVNDELTSKVLEYCIDAKTSKEIRKYLGISSKSYLSTYILKPLIDNGKLSYTNKKSINARNQKYITIKK